MADPPVTAPAPTVVPDLWDLRARPPDIEAEAVTWRRLRTGADDAEVAVDSASRQVLGDGSWSGDAADSYATHRARLTGALTELSELAGRAADAFDAIAYALRWAQSQLDDQLSALSSTVPATRAGGRVTFQPADAAQAELVRRAVSEARQVRSWVDERLASSAAALRAVREQLAGLGAGWTDPGEDPRTLRLLNLNAGRGAGNTPNDEVGTEDGELSEITGMIVDQDANVVTLQEVYHDDVHGFLGMVDQLEMVTGDDWEAHFTPADHKINAQDGGNVAESVIDNVLPGSGGEFGNAILVRRDGQLIDDTSEFVDETLQEPGDLSIVDRGDEGRSINGARIELAD